MYVHMYLYIQIAYVYTICIHTFAEDVQDTIGELRTRMRDEDCRARLPEQPSHFMFFPNIFRLNLLCLPLRMFASDFRGFLSDALIARGRDRGRRRRDREPRHHPGHDRAVLRGAGTSASRDVM